MRVFVTGATGFVGSAIVQDLIHAGHQVVGLSRSDAGAKSLAAAGAQVHRGGLDDLESLRRGAAASEGVIHTAFIHDWANTTMEAAAEVDRRAVETLAAALEGSNKPLVVTSGTGIAAFLAPGRLATEDIAPTPAQAALPRVASELATMAAAGLGVRASIVRLPQVHGAGDRHGFVPQLIGIARRTGFSAFIGDGANRWPAAHRLDVARLYRLALEKAAAGTHLHAVAEEGIPMRAIAETIGQGLGVPVRSLTADEAPAHFDWFARFAAMDNPSSSAVTRKALGWNPQGPELLEDMKQSGYFS